jgi:hypothetical protein
MVSQEADDFHFVAGELLNAFLLCQRARYLLIPVIRIFEKPLVIDISLSRNTLTQACYTP